MRGCVNCYLRAVKISIVVPAFNEEKLLGDTLAQIKAVAGAFTNIGWDTELIVCDNHSTDRTAEIARAAGAKVVFEPINQISRARNAGAAAATGIGRNCFTGGNKGNGDLLIILGLLRIDGHRFGGSNDLNPES